MIRKIIHIDEEKCNGCGLCATACHEGAIDIINGKAKLVRENFCDGFGDCLPGCPTGAITFEEREAPAYDEAAVQENKKKKELQEKMKAANAYYRKNKTLDGCPVLTQEQIDSLKEKMQKDWHYEDKPFATYQLSNNNAEIHRIEGRLKKLRAAKTEGNTESENEYFRIVENTEIMRLQLFFDGKPEAEVRDILKKNGFRWSRKNNCWQRQLTDNARYSLERVKKELEVLK